MYFYRAMKISEYARFLDGETIQLDKQSYQNYSSFDNFYHNYVDNSDKVDVDITAKFEISDDVFNDLVSKWDANIYYRMDSVTGSRVPIIELSSYNSEICKPVELLMHGESLGFNVIDASEVTKENLYSKYLQEVIKNDGAESVFSVLTDEKTHDSYSLVDKMREYEELYGKSILEDRSVLQMNIPKEFAGECYYANNELRDATMFFHAKNIISMYYESIGASMPQQEEQLIQAMSCAINSDKRYFVNIDSREEDISKVGIIETDTFVARNVLCNNLEYHTPVWEVTLKEDGVVPLKSDSLSHVYLDTESMIQLLDGEKIKGFTFNNQFIEEDISFTAHQKEITSVDELKTAYQEVKNESLEDIDNLKKDLLHKFGLEEMFSVSDVDFYTSKDVVFHDGTMSIQILDRENPDIISVYVNDDISFYREIDLSEYDKVTVADVAGILNDMKKEGYLFGSDEEFEQAFIEKLDDIDMTYYHDSSGMEFGD